MKKSFLLITVMIIFQSGMFLGCQKDYVTMQSEKVLVLTHGIIQPEVQPEDGLTLKSGSIGYIPACEPSTYPLLNRHGVQRGSMLVSNNETYLQVKFVADESFSIDDVKFWIGKDWLDVPMNNREIPIPGKFTYKKEESKDCEFMILLTDISADMEFFQANNPLYLFALVRTKNNETGEFDSVWSDGEPFNVSRWGSYSSYICCGLGSKGCFPHMAYVGETISNINYFTKWDGQQNMYTDNDEIAGYVEYYDKKIVFNFEQNWMFTDLVEPTITVYGFNDLNSASTYLYSGEPYSNPPNESFYLPFDYDFNYYIIILNLQFCNTSN